MGKPPLDGVALQAMPVFLKEEKKGCGRKKQLTGFCSGVWALAAFIRVGEIFAGEC